MFLNKSAIFFSIVRTKTENGDWGGGGCSVGADYKTVVKYD